MMVFILLFFFFKQKTAYEMRISDWSSDVCSSDLALGVALADYVIVEDLADFARRRNAIARFRDRRPVVFLDDVHAQFDAFIADEHRRTGNQQIGRASCRERVCQYV